MSATTTAATAATNVVPAAVELAQSLRGIPTLEAVILFGSAATGEMHKKSDIDLLLLFSADHNPETGDEGKLVYKRAREIEQAHKLENPFSFVFVNRGEEVDSTFLWEVAKDGHVLYCTPESILGRVELGHLKPAVFISYALSKMPPKDRMYIDRQLYGYTVRKVHKGKEYVSEREGLIPRYGKKLGRATFIIDAQKSDDVLRLFNEKGVMYTVTKIWV